MEDYKKLLTDLYSEFDPERIKQIDYFLSRYKGNEKQFYISQKAKYSSKKPVSDSKKIIEEALARIKSQTAAKEKRADEKEKMDSAKIEEEILSENTNELQKLDDVTDGFPLPIEDKASEPIEAEEIDEVSLKENREIPEEVQSKTEIPSQWISEEIVENQHSEIEFENIAPKQDQHKNPNKRTQQAKENNWFDEQQRAPFPSEPRHSTKHSNKKYFLYIFGIVVLIMIMLLVGYYLFILRSAPKTTTENAKLAEAELNEISLPDSKTTSLVDSIAETTSTNTEKETNANSSDSSNASTNGLGRIVPGNIQLPAFFVACYAVKTEKQANAKIAFLKTNGFDARYYWIPDFVPQGNSFFKVVIGPFRTQTEALRTLTPVQERAEFDAYVLQVK